MDTRLSPLTVSQRSGALPWQPTCWPPYVQYAESQIHKEVNHDWTELRSSPVLRGLGLGAAALGGARLLAACGGGSSGLSGDQGGQASQGPSGPKPALNQWYHQYGEAGTQQAVTRYAKEYPDATVKVQWTPGDCSSLVLSWTA